MLPPPPATSPDGARAQAVWRNRLGSAFRTGLACAIVGCVSLYGPHPLKTQLTFPAFSYVTAILIVSDATLGDAMRGCWHAACATVMVVPAAMLSLWVIGPQNFTAGVAAVAVAIGSLVVAVPESMELMTKRIAFGQIVIVCVGAVIHGKENGAVLGPIHVASSTTLGALASLLALLLPYPRLAHFQVKKLCRLYAENASQRINLYMKAFSAQDNITALDAISQAKPFTETGTKLLQTVKLIQEGVLWERPQIRLLKPHFINPGVRLQAMEIPIRGMEIAVTSSPSFPVRIIEKELSEVLLGMELQIGQKLEQAKCSLPFEATTALEAKGEIFNKFHESLPTVNLNIEDLTTSFFLFLIKLLQDDLTMAAKTECIIDRSNINEEPRITLKEAKCGFKRICSNWCVRRPKIETLTFAVKYSLSLGLAVFFGLIFNKENGYWSGLTIAISFTEGMQATFTMANARAQGTALGSVYGVLGCFFFQNFDEAKVLALLPWIIFISFLRHSQMYGQSGAVSAVIGALLILGRKNYGPPAEFAICRLTEAFIGLCCFIVVELLLQPTRAATLAKRQLSQSLGKLQECIGEVGLSSDPKDKPPKLREKQEKLRTCVDKLQKFAGEAELEPNFWFLPFRIACYNKLFKSISKMADLLLFMAYRMEFLVEASQSCGLAWKELQEPINSDLELFKKNVNSSLECLEKITLIKCFAVIERETHGKKIHNDLELGKSSNTDERRMHADAEKIVSSFLQHSKEATDKIWAEKGEERRKNEMAVCLSAIGFCISGLMRETKELEKGIKELIRWENPSRRINFYEISGKINALYPE
ncbi:hypothetical protein HYC85_006634 [Camellia sinensis]|uniref:Integral membrane bound transporter domain-containing protein n=1 Tax=Camellia sinensis TaxID=4442 RepID=A0A7J7HP61_CAMSI|nr:hypothetical protein HYC85_006634 [Camellia sinensis]